MRNRPLQAAWAVALSMLVLACSSVPDGEFFVLKEVHVTANIPSHAVGETDQFTATGTYSDGSTSVITTKVTWASDDLSVATVTSGGLVSAVGAGSVGIYATLDGVTGSASMTVTTPPISPAATAIDYYVPMNAGTSFGIAHIWWDEANGWDAETQPFDLGPNALVALDAVDGYLFGREGGPLATSFRVFEMDPNTGALQEDAASPLTASEPGGFSFNIVQDMPGSNLALVDFTSNPPSATAYELSLSPLALGAPLPPWEPSTSFRPPPRPCNTGCSRPAAQC